MRNALLSLSAAGLAVAGCLWLVPPAAALGVVEPVAAPAFTHHQPRDWLHSEPLTWQALSGQVVLLDFWAFRCWNCYRSFPWLNALKAQLADAPFTVIGVHTPEFEAEKDRAAVAAHAEKYGLTGPIMIDNDYSYWNAMGNRYWPAWYVIDQRGRVRYRFIGETHAGDARAKRMEAAIRKLLAESGSINRRAR